MDMLEAARSLGHAIQSDEAFIGMMLAQQANDKDEQLQNLIGEFNLKRVALNSEINKQEKDQAKISALNDEIKDIYGKVMANPNMRAYNDAKSELDQKIDFVMQILRASIEGQDPDAFQPQAGCSGSCSSCSGCQ